MPNFSASALRAGLVSTPTIMLAPAMRAPCTTLRPIPPRPNTTTFARVERNDVIAFFHARAPRAGLDHDARALVAENRREQTLRVGPRAREFVGMANAGRLDLDQHFAGLRPLQLHGLDA